VRRLLLTVALTSLACSPESDETEKSTSSAPAVQETGKPGSATNEEALPTEETAGATTSSATPVLSDSASTAPSEAGDTSTAPDESGTPSDTSTTIDSTTPAEDNLYSSGSRIRIVWLQGDDGSKQFVGLWDSERGERCSWSLIGEETRCLPVRMLGSGLFADSGCLQALTSFPKGCAGLPEYQLVYVSSACGLGNSSYTHRGEEWEGDIFYGSPASCNAFTRQENTRYFKQGSPVTASDFVRATETIE
jgi:hypothetical protein